MDQIPQTGGMVVFLPHKFHHVGVDSAFVLAYKTMVSMPDLTDQSSAMQSNTLEKIRSRMDYATNAASSTVPQK